jgi:drug/metabolite transporter (DMT)-like permease
LNNVKEHSPRDIFIADMVLILVSFIWGAGIPLSAVLARGITPLWAIALRMLFAALFLVILFPKRILRATKYDWATASIQTAILTSVFIFMTFGLIYSTASKQAFIGGLNVIMVPFFVWLLYKKPPRPWIFLGAFITTAGLLTMGFTPGMEFNFGDLLSFFMAVSYGLQVMGAGYCSRRVEPVTLVAIHIIMLAVVLTAIALLFEPIPDMRSFSPKIWGALLCVSLLNTILCFILQFKAQKITPETHAAVIFSLEGLFGYGLAVIFGQDPFHLQGAIGGLIIILGMIITESENVIKEKALNLFGNN